VIEELGEKVIEALVGAVDAARDDLRVYRAALPDMAAQSSARGLANWIHDRVWHHSVRMLDSVDDAVCYEKGPFKEVIVKDRYRIRLKRHRPPAAVSTFPTQGAIDFMEQPDGQRVLEGMEQLRLIFGYGWDQDSDDMGPAVLSMRHGIKNVLWVHEVPSMRAPAAPLPTRAGPASSVVRARLEDTVEEARRSRQP
jgi:hypothetical protein